MRDVYTQKIVCPDCQEEFMPSSRHKSCPICRHKKAKHPCENCGILIGRKYKLCNECQRKLHPHLWKDEFSSYKEFVRRAKRRNMMTNITVEELKAQMESQNFICPYSGVTLILPVQTHANNNMFTASLNRIDSNKPYTADNIQFVSIAMNYMKQCMTHDETIELCKILSRNWK